MQRTVSTRVARIAASLLAATLTVSCGSSSEPPPPVASVALTPVDDTLRVGETAQLTATTKDADGTTLNGRVVTWASSSPGVASVSQAGLVTGVTDGTTTITATSENKTATALIRVFGPCSTALAVPIAVGQTINGALAATDCRLSDNTFADGYALIVNAATNVQIDMTAPFDTYLVLLELVGGNLVERAVNDDVDPDDQTDPNDPVDTNSRVTFLLQPNAQYFILANSFDPNVTGTYQLKVTSVAFAASASVRGKPGKAPIASLLKAIKTK
jgi:Big-like domain-containing protein